MGCWELCRIGMDHWERCGVGMDHLEVGMGH